APWASRVTIILKRPTWSSTWKKGLLNCGDWTTILRLRRRKFWTPACRRAWLSGWHWGNNRLLLSLALKLQLARRSAPVLAAPYTHLVSRSSAGFQPAVSPISNRHGWRRLRARGKARKTSRLEALRYSRLET